MNYTLIAAAAFALTAGVSNAATVSAPFSSSTSEEYISPIDGNLYNVARDVRQQADFGILKTEASISLTNTNQQAGAVGTNLPDTVRSLAVASFTDRWNVGGGIAGTQGTISLSFNLDGSSISPDVTGGPVFGEGNAFAQTSIELLRRDGNDGSTDPFGGLLESLDEFSAPKNGAIDQVVTLQRTFTYGDFFDIHLRMASVAIIETTGFDYTSTDVMASTSFFNTLSLSNIEVRDQNGALQDFSLFSDSNAQNFERFAMLNDPTNPTTPIPLPAGAVLMVTAIAGLGFVRRRKKL